MTKSQKLLIFNILFLFIVQLGAQEASFNRVKEKIFKSVSGTYAKDLKNKIEELKEKEKNLVNEIRSSLGKRFIHVQDENDADKSIKNYNPVGSGINDYKW